MIVTYLLLLLLLLLLRGRGWGHIFSPLVDENDNKLWNA